MKPPADPAAARRAARPAPLLEGRRVASLGHPPAGEFTYTVVEARPAAVPAEKRGRTRQRTRLRTGKIIDARGSFVTECLIYDRSDTGGRLRLPANVALGAAIQLYEDQSATLYQADIVWRRDRDVGVRIRPAASTPRSRVLEAEMRRRFYAMKR